MKLNFSFSVRGPDRVAEELATVLSKKGAWEFKSLFDMVHANLRAKDLVRGGEEMLRLRTYEKLQNFLQAGIVKKAGKEYAGVPQSLAAFFKTSAEFNARFASGTHCRPALNTGGVKVETVAPAAKVVKSRRHGSPRGRQSKRSVQNGANREKLPSKFDNAKAQRCESSVLLGCGGIGRPSTGNRTV